MEGLDEFNKFSRSNSPSHTDACSGIEFSCRVHRNSSLPSSRDVGESGEFQCFEIIKAEMFVDTIFDDNAIGILFDDVIDALKLCLSEDFTSRIMRGVNQNNLCFLIDGFLEEIKIDIPEIFFSYLVIGTSLFDVTLRVDLMGSQRYGLGDSTSHLNLSTIAIVTWIKKDNFFTWID